MEPLTIVIVDDHPIVREGVRMILENDPGMHVIGEAGSVSEACEVVKKTKPDVILLDINLGSESSVEHIGEIRACSVDSKLLVLTGMLDEESNTRAAENGAMGVVLKHQAATTLKNAIRKVNDGEVWFDRAFTARLIGNVAKRNTAEFESNYTMSTLTDREREIVELIVEGLVNKDIAKRLDISEKTVRNHLTVIYSKLGVSSRLELGMYISRRRPRTTNPGV